MLWSKTYDSDAREVYTKILQDRIPQIRDELRGIAKPENSAIISIPITLPKSSNKPLPQALPETLPESQSKALPKALHEPLPEAINQ